jgi:hypothetical protein
VLHQSQLLRYMSNFLSNKQSRALKQTVSNGTHLVLKNMGAYACLSSPDRHGWQARSSV